MSAHRTRTLAAALAALAAPIGADAQRVGCAAGDARCPASADSAWSPRGWFDGASVALHGGPTWSRGDDQAHALFDRVLAPGSDALGPWGIAAQLRLRATRTVNVDVALETGRAAVESASRIAPIDRTGDVRQTTRLDIASLATVGLSWRAWAWRTPGGADGDERLRLTLGAGFGQARYRLRQWGDFVDTERRITFGDDFRSRGASAVGYVAAGAEVPVAARLSLDVQLAQYAGRAPMNGGFGRFDAFDLGGTRLRVGVRMGGLRR